MPQIDIDFEVFKALTNLRQAEEDTYNHVIRSLLKLPLAVCQAKPPATGKPWIVSDTSFPAGSEFSVDYKGRQRTGVVRDGKLELDDGHRFSTPSAAAIHVTSSNVNGWRFWKCRLPSSSQFVLIERLRGKSH